MWEAGSVPVEKVFAKLVLAQEVKSEDGWEAAAQVLPPSRLQNLPLKSFPNPPTQFPSLSARFSFPHPFIFPCNYFIHEYLMTDCKKSLFKSSFQNVPLSLIILMGSTYF